jgi:2-isopropylmalate synthase
MGLSCISDVRLKKLTEVSRYVGELANLRPFPRQPYVGTSAFIHKGGLHVSGVSKWEESYQHIDPEAVGNRSGVLVSELSGVSNIVRKARERGLPLSRREEARRILNQVKSLESRGFQYEEAEASFELLVRRGQPDYKPPFELIDFMVVVESRRRPASGGGEILAEATVKVRVGEQVMHTASEGDGPVNALDNALRKALTWFYPSVAQVRLTDYKVRILDETAGTESQVRVLIESGDGRNQWRTVGSSTNIIEASWLALADSLEYWLVKNSGN